MTAFTRQHHRLHDVRQALKKRRFFYIMIIGLTVLGAAGISFLLLESVFWFDPAVRIALVVTFTAGLALFLYFGLAKPAVLWINRNSPSDDDLALLIGSRFPEIGDRLVNSLQVVRDHSAYHDGSSRALAEVALEETDRDSEFLDYTAAADEPALLPPLRTLGIVLISGMMLFLIFRQPMTSALHHLSHPRTRFERPMPFDWQISPGHIKLVQGDSLSISVLFNGPVPESTVLILREPQRAHRSIALNPPFSYRIPSIQQSFDYQVSAAGKFFSPLFHVSVQKRPVVRQLNIRLMPPAYTGLPAQELEPNQGDIHALKGTRIRLSVSASQALSRAVLTFENSGTRLMTLIPPNRAAAEWMINRPDQYTIAVIDTQLLENINPIQYRIQIRPDLNPAARIPVPGEDVDLDENMVLPLTLEGEDDFGFSAIRLVYWITRGGLPAPAAAETLYQNIAIGNMRTNRFVQNINWDLDPMALLPQDRIAYFLQVFDNDAVSGPKHGRSDIYVARFPSMMEIFENVNRMQSGQTETLEDIAKDGSSLEEKLHELTEDLKANREVPWEEKRQIRESVEKQMRLEQEMEALNTQIETMTEQLEKNDLISEETLQKYEQLQALFEEMATPELQDAMKKFQESLELMDEEALRQAAENMEISQEMLMKSLDRTIALLQRIQMEQKIDEMIARVEAMAEQQAAVNESLDQSGATDDLAGRESDLAQDARSFEQAMEEMAGNMETMPDMPMETMQSLMDSLNRQSPGAQMEQMGEQLQQKQEQAQQTGQQISQTLAGLSQGLQQMKQSMQGQQNKKAKESLERAAFQTLQLSQTQENLIRGMQQGGVTGSEAAQQQAAMMQGVEQISDSLYQMSMQMMGMTPQIGRSLGRAGEHMRQAAQAMQQSQGGISQEQGQAMGALNEAAAMLQEMLGNMQGDGAGGMGMEQFMMQLGNMSEQQMALNRKMADMLGKGILNMQQQAAMSRMAGEQRAVQQRMEQLLRDYGERPDVAGRLGDLIEAMETVIDELQANQASQRTLDRQEQILSRMLEAQRSMHERDVSRKRQARTGRQFNRQGPGPLDPDQSALREQMVRDLLRLREAGYTEDYQDLIRRYFDALGQLIEDEKSSP